MSLQDGKEYLFLNENFEEDDTGRRRWSSYGLLNPSAYFRVWPEKMTNINLSKIYTFLFSNTKINRQSLKLFCASLRLHILISSTNPSNLYLHLIFTSQIFLVFLLSHAFYICVKSPSFLLSYLAVVRVVGNPIWTRNSPTGYKFRLLPLQ